MEIILTHKNADFDAVASMLGAHKLYPHAIPILPKRQNRNVAEFLTLYQNGLPFIKYQDMPHEAIKRIILTDTQYKQDLKTAKEDTPTLIIDHHKRDREFEPQETWAGDDTLGAITTLLVEQIQQQQITLQPIEATLMALGIYADTGLLTYRGTTVRDVQAVAWLLEQGAVLDTVRRFLENPLSDEQRALFDHLLENTQTRNIKGFIITVAIAMQESYLMGINTVTHHLQDILDTNALFVIVQMPNNIQLVARSNSDAIHVGKIAESLGGGGHIYAAAASIHNRTLAEINARIWEQLQTIPPATSVGEIMSFGVNTLNAADKIQNIIQRIRRIGHEGYPVVQANQVVGLLTRRDADRALEHQLTDLTVKDVMMEGNYTLQPNASVYEFEDLIIESGWGQIPVADENEQLIGIVTRTDLITYWGHKHRTEQQPLFSMSQIEAVLGKSVTELIQIISKHAQGKDWALYLVGGVVRDLFLERLNLDIDFVIEQDAIAFAQSLAQLLGGEVHSHAPFGTARWHLTEKVASSHKLPFAELPHHIDFATARFEYYENPTALPTVYNSGIKLDLQRRDFTINTLAIQLSPFEMSGQLLDYYHGMKDLNQHLIRVLHSLSFVDDPTRILRAVRFSVRLQFAIEARTIELIQSALPMLKRITGERLRNELTLLLQEKQAVQGIKKLAALGALQAIHPAFTIREQLDRDFARLSDQPIWETASHNPTELTWHILLCRNKPEDVKAICERLLFGKQMKDSLVATANLLHLQQLNMGQLRPSEIVTLLENIPLIALHAAWLLGKQRSLQSAIDRFMTEWQHIKPTVTGNTLKEMGLAPGPHYKEILDQIRAGWLDGEIQNEIDEEAFLSKLLSEGDLL